jgi:hypothetical protein
MHSLLAHLSQLVPSVGFALFAIVVLTAYPGAYLIVWLLTICFVPWWVGYTLVTFLPAAVLVSLFGLICMTPGVSQRITLPDWGVFGFFVACLLPVVVGGSTRSATFGVAAVWLPGYLVGRRLPLRVDLRWIYGAVAVFFSAVSVLAIAEFFFVWNPFVKIRIGSSISSYATWGTLQSRGDVLRAEGAFGHSIALGSSIAMAVPLVLASRFRQSLRVVAVGLMLGATVVTFSRSAMICAVLGVVVSVLFLRDIVTPRLRTALVALVVIMAIVLVPFLNETFSAAGSEATRSADYRGQLAALVSQINFVGLSDSAQRLGDGELYFGQFHSIDSQLILSGLTYGAFALIVACVLLIVGIGAVLRRRASPPLIAVVCQVPALFTVALITQYSVYFWFVVGLAVAAQASSSAIGRVEIAHNRRTAETAFAPLRGPYRVGLATRTAK